MKKICVLLVLAFCMSFCTVANADVDANVNLKDSAIYINGIYAYNTTHDLFSSSLSYSSGIREYNFGNGNICQIYDSDYTNSSNNYTYFGLKIYRGYDLYSDNDHKFVCDPGEEDEVVLKTAICYAPSADYKEISVYIYATDDVRFFGQSQKLFDLEVSDIDFTEPTLTMTLNNVTDPLTDDFYVEAVNGYSERGFIKTQYQASSDDDYTAVNELTVPASSAAKFTAKELNVTKAGKYTFTLYDPSSMLKGVQVLEITSDYVAPDDGGGGSDDDTDEDLFNFVELPEDANVLDYIKYICTNVIELFKGIGRCIKKFVTQTKEMSSILTKFFSFMPTEFTLILTLGMMFLVLLRFLGR